jgi:cytochrome d ubiquinol oxidase subunit I
MLISFALGVVTGIVQEFQFGMNWSNYSRFVGDIFGAPLAMEGLAAFFVESTFLGLWLFGWGRLPEKVHLACIWAVSASTALSAYFILAANSWMQHPVGYEMVDGKPKLDSIFAVLGNSTAIYALAHTLLAAAITGMLVVISISAWHVLRGSRSQVYPHSLRIALPVLAVAATATVVVGHFNGVLMTHQQPMKMAAADAVFEDKDGAGLSLFATGDFKSNPEGLNRNVEIPNVLSWITTGYPRGEIRGINDINAEYQQKYGPGDYAPIVAVAYWSWRAMLGIGFLAAALGFFGWYLIRRGKLESSRRYLKFMVFGAALPFIANSMGWIFTEMGRQPWVVFGMLKTSDAGSPAVSTAEVLITLIGFTLLYAVLAIIAGRIFLEKARKGADEPADAGGAEAAYGGDGAGESESEDDLALAY